MTGYIVTVPGSPLVSSNGTDTCSPFRYAWWAAAMAAENAGPYSASQSGRPIIEAVGMSSTPPSSIDSMMWPGPRSRARRNAGAAWLTAMRSSDDSVWIRPRSPGPGARVMNEPQRMTGPRGYWAPRRPTRWYRRWSRTGTPRLAFLAIAVAVLVGCSGSMALVADNAGWTRSANFTTCDQWAGEMTADQRTAMARSLLPILRSTVDSAASDGLELAPTLVSDISSTCASDAVQAYDDYVVTAAAALAFTGDKSLQP